MSMSMSMPHPQLYPKLFLIPCPSRTSLSSPLGLRSLQPSLMQPSLRKLHQDMLAAPLQRQRAILPLLAASGSEQVTIPFVLAPIVAASSTPHPLPPPHAVSFPRLRFAGSHPLPTPQLRPSRGSISTCSQPSVAASSPPFSGCEHRFARSQWQRASDNPLCART